MRVLPRLSDSVKECESGLVTMSISPPPEAEEGRCQVELKKKKTNNSWISIYKLIVFLQSSVLLKLFNMDFRIQQTGPGLGNSTRVFSLSWRNGWTAESLEGAVGFLGGIVVKQEHPVTVPSLTDSLNALQSLWLMKCPHRVTVPCWDVTTKPLIVLVTI